MSKARKVIIEILLSSATGRNRLQGVFNFLRGRCDWDIRLPQTQEEFEKALSEPVDGIIVSRAYSDALLRTLENMETPVVFMDVDRRERRVFRAIDVTVANDNGGIGLAAGAYLFGLGKFRSYGYVPSAEPKWWCDRRRRGFAVALEACRRVRVRVPDQVAILGVDNDELICQIARPELSSIRPDTEGEGFEAAKALHALMCGAGKAGRRTILKRHLGIVERASTRPPPPAAHLVQSALDYIARNAVKGITSDDVAKRVGCSRRLLELRFAEFHTESVHAALVRTRLAAVCRELALSDRKFIHIARECGFKNAAVLKNLFRKTYGMSMRDYRKRHSGAAEQ